MGFGVSEVWAGKRSADVRQIIGGEGKRRKKDLSTVVVYGILYDMYYMERMVSIRIECVQYTVARQ